MSGLLMSHREKISCMWHFQTVVLKTVLLRVVVSIYVMKTLAKESKLLSLCPLQFHGFVVKWKKFSLRINLSISGK